MGVFHLLFVGVPLQQPYEITEVTGTEEVKGIGLIFTVYPNPSSDFLALKVESYEMKNLNYQLFNIKGILLQNGEILSQETVVDEGPIIKCSDKRGNTEKPDE